MSSLENIFMEVLTERLSKCGYPFSDTKGNRKIRYAEFRQICGRLGIPREHSWSVLEELSKKGIVRPERHHIILLKKSGGGYAR